MTQSQAQMLELKEAIEELKKQDEDREAALAKIKFALAGKKS